MNLFIRYIALLSIAVGIFVCSTNASDSWLINKSEEWKKHNNEAENIEFAGGQAISTEANSRYSSTVKNFDTKRAASSITFRQSHSWDNWREIYKIGVPEMDDAPVLVPVKDGDYYLLARYRPKSFGPKKWVDGVDVSDTRPPSEQGYHAWHSTNMKDWKHYGPVSGYRERWVTTAEYFNGSFYIYYDNPNDQDPHLIIDKNLKDGKMGKDIGMVFADPSHGSDCGIIRDDADGKFHMFYENWDPINAKTHAWDSPLAGHAISPNGIHDFSILEPVVDHRTTATGRFGEYIHSSSQAPLRYEIHEPEQNAYGDWTAIKVGDQYYLFCDYDPVDEPIRIGRFTSDSLNNEFEFVGELGEGHPDPTVGFAEGRFYLIRQRARTDFVSPGPWVEGVEARVGVDISGNGTVDQWTDWQEVSESYSQKSGFTRVIEKSPARLELTDLPSGYGFVLEYRTNRIKEQSVNVEMESVELRFRESRLSNSQ